MNKLYHMVLGHLSPPPPPDICPCRTSAPIGHLHPGICLLGNDKTLLNDVEELITS